MPKRPITTSEKFIELKRSQVRRIISYSATTFLFGGSIALGIWLLVGFDTPDVDHAMQVFNTVLPIATGIIGYWFAEQNNKKNRKDEDYENRS